MQKNPVPETIQGIYVDLDALLDTRLSTLFLIHEDLVSAALNNGYAERLQDAFTNLHPSLTLDKFKELYAGRDNEVLHNASYTRVLNVLKEAVTRLVKMRVATPFATEIQIYVNAYPYTLTEKEEQDIAKSLLYHTSNQVDVQFLRLSDKELLPEYCSKTFSLMIRYDYAQWIDGHAETNAIKYHPLTMVKVLVPERFEVRLPNREEWERMKSGKFDPFKNMEVTWAPIVGLNFLPIGTFSIDLETHWKPFLQAHEKAKAAEPAA